VHPRIVGAELAAADQDQLAVSLAGERRLEARTSSAIRSGASSIRPLSVRST